MADSKLENQAKNYQVSKSTLPAASGNGWAVQTKAPDTKVKAAIISIS